MQVREAKDFLVRQTAEQAAIENVPLSTLEKRMIYFTETGDLSEDPAKLNEEFEAAHDTDEFEGKISILLHHAYKRVKKENPESVRRWDDAIRTLRKGDHYLLVLWDQGPKERPPYDSLKLLGAGILVAAAMFVFAFVWDRFAHFPSFVPGWIARRLIALSVVALYFVGLYYWRRTKN